MIDITTTTECTIEDYRQMLHQERENLEHQQKYSRSLENKAQKLEQQLAIAVEALELYKNFLYDGTLKGYESIAKKALQQIKDLDK